jgi:trehalose-phosphatase
LLFDFDGTLAPIVLDPAWAQMLPAAREAMARLAAQGAALLVASGRKLDDVAARVGLPQLAYAGCGGLELQLGGRRILPANADELTRHIDSVATELGALLGGTRCRLEPKGLSVAVHWRGGGPDDEQAARQAVSTVSARPGVPLRVTPGKMVLEVAPAGAGKRKAVSWFLSTLPPDPLRAVVYAGDDRIDEEAFEAVHEVGGAGILVGEPVGPTAAGYGLESPEATADWLLELAAARTPEGQPPT